jgi:hypothetical protein
MAHQSHHGPPTFPKDVSSSPSPDQGRDSKWGAGRIGGTIVIVLIIVLIIIGMVLHALQKRDEPRRARPYQAEGEAATGRTEGAAQQREQGDGAQRRAHPDEVAANINRTVESRL